MNPEHLGQAVVLLAESAEKTAASGETSYALTGKLVLSQTGYLLLTVPNALVRGAFQAMSEPGVDLPGSNMTSGTGELNAHITVMRPEEIAQIEGGGDAIIERGKDFSYTLGPLRSMNPAGWGGVSRVWFISVRSPELKKLRRSYGLTALPKNDTYDFHITVAVRRKNAFRKTGSLLYERPSTEPTLEWMLGDVKFAETAGELKKRVADARKDVGEPTEAQAEAGNYRKGHVKMHGLDIAIENPKGGTRSGTDADGNSWSVKMKHDYGYIKRTTGKDGDHVDVFLGPNPESEIVFIVNQNDKSGKFDEHKCMLGFTTEQDARKGYLANYADGWTGLGSIKPMTMGDFKTWLKGDTTKKAKVDRVPTVAVDLDGTIIKKEDWQGEDHFSDTRPGAKKALKYFQKMGWRIIIFTVRGDVQKVKDMLHSRDIPYDYVNENPDQPPNSSHKVYADVYIDDRGLDARQSWAKITTETERRMKAASVKFSSPLDQLRLAKQHSDRGDYGSKHMIARQLMTEAPDDFEIDSEYGNVVGVTHSPGS